MRSKRDRNVVALKRLVKYWYNKAKELEHKLEGKEDDEGNSLAKS